MKSKGYSGQAVVLARRNFGEADRIIAVFSDDHGKISLLAKGIRKPKSRKRGHLEVFSLIRFQAVKTNSIDLITEVETINAFEGVRKDLKKISVAYFLVEAVGKITHDGQPHRNIFELLVKYLTLLKNSDNLKSLRLDFVRELLTTTGFWPIGKKIDNPDLVLEEVTERKMNSVRVGKKVIQ